MALCTESYGNQILGERQRQEDSFRHGTLGRYTYAILADGLGGHPRGDVASGMAVSHIEAELNRLLQMPDGGSVRPKIAAAIRSAHESIALAAGDGSSLEGMATTLVAVVVDTAASRAWACSVGDSHVLKFEAGASGDFEFVPDEFFWGANTGYVDHALGLSLPRSGIRIAEWDLNPGDRLLLASDGAESLCFSDIQDFMDHSGSAKDAVQSILHGVQEEDDPHQDNATVVAVFAKAA